MQGRVGAEAILKSGTLDGVAALHTLIYLSQLLFCGSSFRFSNRLIYKLIMTNRICVCVC